MLRAGVSWPQVEMFTTVVGHWVTKGNWFLWCLLSVIANDLFHSDYGCLRTLLPHVRSAIKETRRLSCPQSRKKNDSRRCFSAITNLPFKIKIVWITHTKNNTTCLESVKRHKKAWQEQRLFQNNSGTLSRHNIFPDSLIIHLFVLSTRRAQTLLLQLTDN